MVKTNKWHILFFYLLVILVLAYVGNNYWGMIGFERGVLIGMIVSIGLWLSVGRNMSE